MSMPFLVFSCRRCDFEGSDTVVWGRFSYLANNIIITLNRKLGWCNKCSGLVAIESLPSDETLKAWEEKISIAKNNHDMLVLKNQNRPWFKKLIGMHNLYLDIKHAEFIIGYLEKNLNEDIFLQSALSSRISKPRCLNCGSEEIFTFNHVSPSGTFDNPGSPVPSGIIHPNCGGELFVSHSKIRLSLALTHRIYDLEGRFIRKEPISLYGQTPQRVSGQTPQSSFN